MTSSKSRSVRGGHDPADPDKDKLPLIRRLSPSSTLKFQQCPKAFEYRYIKRLADPATIHTARGTLIHEACEKVFDFPREERTPEKMVELLHEVWPEMRTDKRYKHLFFEPVLDGSMPEGGNEQEFLSEAERMVKQWFEVEDPTIFDPDEREFRMEVDLDNVPLVGILDRAVRFEGGLSISDYKSGKVHDDRFERKAFFGLRVYAAMYRQITGETPTHLRLVYLKEPVVKQIRCNDRMCDQTIKELKGVWDAILKAWERDNWPTKTGPLCNWCAYQDICPAWNVGAPEVAEEEDDAAGGERAVA